MLQTNLPKTAATLLSLADIQINGGRAHDIQIHNEAFYKRVFSQGSLGLGESYVDGWWDCQSLDTFFYHLLSADLSASIKPSLSLLYSYVQAKLFNLQAGSRTYVVGQEHYDLGNDLYNAMLDKRLVYTCGYWKNATNLDEAQEAKLDLVCKKLQLEPNMTILDVGCGWGSFAKYAAEKYKARVTGITVSKEQVELGKSLCKWLPVEIRYQDYRDLNQSFDRIVSLGMFEHVGYKNYRTYMKIMQKCLKDDGLFLLHTIGGNNSYACGDPWLNKYIFPNSMLPSASQITQAVEGIFVVEDWHNFSAYYDPTLMAWFNNFNNNWPILKNTYSERFYRMWKYYLLSCAGLFRARKGQLWQLVLSNKGLPGGYTSYR